jgi:hypothetical protein
MQFLLVMFSFFSEKIHLVQTCSSGYVNLIQEYDIMDACLLSSEINSMNLKTGFPGVDSFKAFLQSIGEAIVLLLNQGLAKENFQPPYSQPVQKRFAQYLEIQPRQSNITWLHQHLVTIRSTLFSMDNLIPKFVMQYGILVASILDNVIKFVGIMSGIIVTQRCELQVIPPLKLFVLQPW